MMEEKQPEIKAAEKDSATNMPDGKSVPSQAQGTEMMGIG